MTELLDLGRLYVSDFLAPGEEPRAAPAELRLVMDDDTGVVHLAEQPPAELMWGRYWYRSGTNATMRAELFDIVRQVSQLVHLETADVWVDIASNDGTLLSFVDGDLCRIGVDPVEGDIHREAKRHATAIVQEPFTSTTFLKDYPKAKVVTCIAMFYDLMDPTDFLAGVHDLLADDGVFVLQMSYTPLMLEQLAFDNICHEHARYYTLTTLRNTLFDAGFVVVDVELNDTNGGSFRITAQHADGKPLRTQPWRDVADMRVFSLLAYESTCGYNTPAVWGRFVDRLETLRADVCRFVRQAKVEGNLVYAYGACYDDATRALTPDGFKRYDELAEGDLVLTLDPATREIVWNPISEVMIYDYDGELVLFEGKRQSLAVTPNHRMLVDTRRGPLRFDSAERLAGISSGGYPWLPVGHWDGERDDADVDLRTWVDQDAYRLRARRVPDKIATDDFLYLLGLYIGDGYCVTRDQGFSVNFCVPEGDKARQPLEDTLNRLGIGYRSYQVEVQVASKALVAIFGECGHSALTKRIPRWALDYSPRWLEHLLRGLVDSDGWYDTKGRRRYVTSSAGLVGDMVELCVKLGMHPSVSRKDGRTNLFRDGHSAVANEHWVINIATTQPAYRHRGSLPYQGKVWCLSVENRNFLVERNGKIAFCGNSTKGNTLLQYFGLDHTLIDGIAERQESKVGLRTVGTNIPIVSEAEWRAAAPEYTLMLPWHFQAEFVEREAAYLDGGGRFIVPCPRFEVIGDGPAMAFGDGRRPA